MCMGHTHSLSGAAAWLALAGPAAAAVGHPQTIGTVLAGAVACAGAALVPDLDHPDGTAAHFFGWPSEMLARLVAWLSGGHRHGTHTFAFCGLAGASILALQQWAPHVALLVVMAVLVGLGLRGVGIAPPRAGMHFAGFVIFVESLAGVWQLDQHVHGSWPWIAPAVALGCLVHTLGDCLTPQRCPLLLPFTHRRYGIGFIRKTGNWLEVKVLAPLLVVTCAGLLTVQYWPLFERQPPETAVTSTTR